MYYKIKIPNLWRKLWKYVPQKIGTFDQDSKTDLIFAAQAGATEEVAFQKKEGAAGEYFYKYPNCGDISVTLALTLGQCCNPREELP